MTLPCLSPSTWISMWRGSVMNFSMKTRSSPNEDAASDLARAKPSATSSGGIGDAHALAAAAGRGLDHHRIADLVGDASPPAPAPRSRRDSPGTVETLAAAAAFFDSILSPIAAMAPGLGPMKTMPASASAFGKGLALGEEAVARMHGLRAGRAGRPRRSCRSRGRIGPPAAGPIWTASSAISTCSASRSASE